jgi:hypothetical protein
MKFRHIALKINLLLLFSAFFYLCSVNSISIKKLGSKTKLDDMQKRDVLIMMAKQFLFPNQGTPDGDFRACIDEKQATTTFWKSVDEGKLKSTLESIGKDCKINSPPLPDEAKIKESLDNVVESYIIKYAAIDGIISSHRGTIPFNPKAINHEPTS